MQRPARIRAAALALALCCAPAPAATPPVLTHPPNTTPREWLLVVEVDARAPRDPYRVRPQPLRTARRFSPVFEISAARVFFPLLEETSSSRSMLDDFNFESRLRWQQVIRDDTPELLPGSAAVGRYGAWDITGGARGSHLRLEVRLPVVTQETRFDEARANEIGWPSIPWPPDVEPALLPQPWVEAASPEIEAWVRRWVGQTPRALPPVRMAKVITGRVVERFQPATIGYEFNTSGRTQGFEMRGAVDAARTGRGSPFDMANLLVASWRAAGLPSRVVIGLDVRETDRRRFTVLRAWAEFYLYDERDGRGEWIPVDPVRQREFSSRAPPIDQRWQFFGHNEELDEMIPIAFHHHPPTDAVAYGSPALWGWLPVPAIPALDQSIRASAFPLPRRGGN